MWNVKEKQCDVNVGRRIGEKDPSVYYMLKLL